jgi:uncharacterized membrane protein
MKATKEDRPILKIKLTLTDKLLEIFGWLILFVFWTATLLGYSNFPEKIPTHYNLTGQPDSFGDNTSIFILPVLSTLLFAGMTILNRFPHVFNYPKKITNQNAERQYTIATRLIRYLKFIVVLGFSIIALITSQAASDKITGLVIWFLLISTGLIYIPLFYAMVKLFKTT